MFALYAVIRFFRNIYWGFQWCKYLIIVGVPCHSIGLIFHHIVFCCQLNPGQFCFCLPFFSSLVVVFFFIFSKDVFQAFTRFFHQPFYIFFITILSLIFFLLFLWCFLMIFVVTQRKLILFVRLLCWCQHIPNYFKHFLSFRFSAMLTILCSLDLIFFFFCQIANEQAHALLQL